MADGAPARPTLPEDPIERGKTCFYAGGGFAQAAPGMERMMVMQHFIYVGAKAFFGSKVTLDNLNEMNTKLADVEKTTPAAALIDQCQAAYPLSLAASPVVLPADRFEQFTICYTANRTMPGAMEGMQGHPRIPVADQKKALEFGALSKSLEGALAKVAPDMAKSSGMDWAAFSAKQDETVPKLPDIGRPDRIIEACIKAFPA